MKISESKATQIASLLLIVLSGVMYWIVCPNYVPDVRTFGVSPRLIPNLCVVSIGLLSAGLFLEAHFEHRRCVRAGTAERVIEFDPAGMKMLLFAIASMVLYQLVVYRVGYLITVAIILAASMYVLGQRKPIVIGCVSLLVPLCYYLFFSCLMNMKMP